MKKLLLLAGTALLAVTAQATSTNEVKGGLDPHMIDGKIKGQILSIRQCYDSGIKAAPKPIAGRVSTHFVIGADGKVSRADIVSSSLKNERVEKCILEC